MGLLRLALISAIFFILCSGWVALLFKVANLQESRLEKVASQVAQGWASEKQRSQWNSNFNLGRKSFLQHGSPQRIKVLAIVGVQTAFVKKEQADILNYGDRRTALRAAWFPSTQDALNRFQEESGIALRFVIGHSDDPWEETHLQEEIDEHGGFLRLPITEGYYSLTNKILVYLRQVSAIYDAEYVIKSDDDVYFRLDRLPHSIKQWQEIGADYVGCMKTGDILSSREYKWFEPQHVLLGDRTYFAHAWGSFYVASGKVAADIGAIRPGRLRFFNNEDVTIGSWMLAFNVTHYDDRRLCEPECSETSIVVYDIPECAGLCDPVKSLPKLHANASCHSPAVPAEGLPLPLLPPIFWFDADKD